MADALSGSPEPAHRKLLRIHLERLKLLDRQIQELSEMAAAALKPHQEAVVRLAKVPGFGPESAQQMVAEVGVDMEAFDSPQASSSWAGVCPGSQISAEQNQSSRCPKGNRYVRRILAEAAHAAVKKRGSHFQSLFRRFVPKLGYNGAIGVVRHRLAQLVWKILHQGVNYIEQGQETNPGAKQRRAQKLARALRQLGYAVTLAEINAEPLPAAGA